jgi:uracil-DNA glycosylase
VLLESIHACRICAPQFPHGPRPVVQLHADARILIAGQAPGRRVHSTGVPFDDVSGDRLRDWMGVGRETFYDPKIMAIVPMGFCFPGKGRSGDLPPRPECAATWRDEEMSCLRNVEFTLVIGRYAQAWHLETGRSIVTDVVQGWRRYWPDRMPLPHPSPRNRQWVSRHPWFEAEVLPALRERVGEILAQR